MGLGKTLQAISFLSYMKFHQGLPGPFRESMRSACHIFLNSLINMYIIQILMSCGLIWQWCYAP